MQRAALGCVALAFVAAALMSAYRYDCDDGYIFARIAMHAAGGHGPVYNIGERVEVYSSPLWLALLIPAPLVGLPVMAWAQLLGVALSLGMLALLFLAPTPSGAPWLRLLGPLVIVSSIGFLAYAGSGMDATLHAALALALALRLRCELDAPARRPLSALIAASAMLARVEAVPLCLAAACCRAFLPPRLSPRQRAGRLGWWLLAAAAPPAVYLAWRRLYFGSLLPNTYIAKAMPPAETLWWGAHYVRDWLAQTAGWPLLALLGALLAWRRLTPGDRAVALLTLAAMLTPAAMPGDWMPFHRLMLPALVLLALTMQQVTGAVWQACPTGRAWQAGTAFAALVVVLQLFQLTGGETRQTLARAARDVAWWKHLGAYLAPRVGRDDTVAVGAAGAISLPLAARVIDFYGLTDPVIARTPRRPGRYLPGHDRSNADRIMATRPRFIVPCTLVVATPLTALAAARELVWSEAEKELLGHPAVAADYALAHVPFEDKYLVIVERAVNE